MASRHGIAMALGLVAAVCAVTGSTGEQSRGEPRRMVVIAHRGGSGIGPENTLTAFRKAIRIGVDYVELDVRTTADGELVIMHDRTVDRTTTGTGEVAKLTYAEIARLHADKSGRGRKYEPVPRFEDVVRLCRGRVGLYIDHKDASVAAVLETLDRVRFGTKAVVYGSPERLAEYRQIRPQMAIMPGHPATLEAMADLMRRLKPEILDGHLREWSEDQVDAAHRLGAAVWMDVLGPTDNEQGWREAIQMGADGLQTDYPDRLLGLLRRLKLR